MATKNRRNVEVASQLAKLEVQTVLLDLLLLLRRASERLPLELEMERVTSLELALLPVLLRRRLRNRSEVDRNGKEGEGSACLFLVDRLFLRYLVL